MKKEKTPKQRKEKKSAPSKTIKEKLHGGRRAYEKLILKKQRSTSIYFLLWTSFMVLGLVIVLSFGFSQQFIMTQSYKSEASGNVWKQGKEIKEKVEAGPPADMQADFGRYILQLSEQHGVRILVLQTDGTVVLPGAPNEEETSRVERQATQLISKLKDGREFAVYEGYGEYVYGTKVTLFGDSYYLYVGQSLKLMQTTLSRMMVWTVLSAVFVVALTFIVSAAVSGLLTRSLSEMTQKAHRLAEGDFNVEFHGQDYGKELVELADALNFARDELSKTDRMQKEIIANVSHDFKTPLTMIKAYASMIMEISGDIPEKRNKHAQVIVDEADRLASLVNDVLDLSKIRSGLDELKIKEFDLSACLKEIIDRFAYLKETQAYTFITDIDEGIYTCADEQKIEQVLYNLIGNAINYTGEDKKVFIRLKAQEKGVFQFSVTDTGKGIKAEELNEIWDRYYRSSEAHKRPVRGTGLGLSIVKSILQRHNLRFGVESEYGKGSTFFVLFPTLDKDKTPKA